MNRLNRRTSALVIRLQEIPPEGESFRYSRASGELNEALRDLVGERDYTVEMTIQPAGNLFQIRGTVTTQLPLLCSRCAYEFEYPVEEQINELLFVEELRPRSSSVRKTNHSSEASSTEPFCNHLSSTSFEIAPYIHEIIASSEPTQPQAHRNCDNQCPHYQEALKKGWVQADLTSEGTQTHRPFAALGRLRPKT